MRRGTIGVAASPTVRQPLAVFGGPTSSGSSGLALKSVPYHTPEPSEMSGQQPSARGSSRLEPTSSGHVASDQSYIPPPRLAARTSSPSPPRAGRTSLVHSPPTSFDDEIAMAEAHDASVRISRRRSPVNMHASQPPLPRHRQTDASRARAAAIAEMEDLENIPPEALFSSPPMAPHRPIRAEASTARSARAGPGPSTQQASVARAEAVLQGSKHVELAVNHPWSKEVNKKLRDVFKLPGFRKHQKEAVDETMAGRDGKPR